MPDLIGVNLIPEALVLRLAYRLRLVRWVCAVAVAVVLVLIPVGMEGWKRVEAEDLRRDRTLLLRQGEAAKKELAIATEQAHEMFLQIERANALRAKRAWSGMFGLLASTMPPSCWLHSVETDPAAPSPTPTAGGPNEPRRKAGEVPDDRTVTIEAPRRLKLIGYAPDPGDPIAFVQNLNVTGVFRAVSLQRSNQEPFEGGYAFRFEIQCEW